MEDRSMTNGEFRRSLSQMMDLVSSNSIWEVAYYICIHLGKVEDKKFIRSLREEGETQRSFVLVYEGGRELTVLQKPVAISSTGTEIEEGDNIEIAGFSSRIFVIVNGNIVFQAKEINDVSLSSDPIRYLTLGRESSIYHRSFTGIEVEKFIHGDWIKDFTFEKVGSEVNAQDRLAKEKEDNRPLTEEEKKVAKNFGIL